MRNFAKDLVEAGLIKTLIDLSHKALDDRTWLRTRTKNKLVYILVTILSDLAKVKEWHDQIYEAGKDQIYCILFLNQIT